MLERKIVDCEESGTTARLTMIPVAAGVAGEGIFVFTGKGALPKRPHEESVNYINKQSVKSLLGGQSQFKYLSVAVPANKACNMPITIYVGNQAVNELIQEIKGGKYNHFNLTR